VAHGDPERGAHRGQVARRRRERREQDVGGHTRQPQARCSPSQRTGDGACWSTRTAGAVMETSRQTAPPTRTTCGIAPSTATGTGTGTGVGRARGCIGSVSVMKELICLNDFAASTSPWPDRANLWRRHVVFIGRTSSWHISHRQKFLETEQ